MRRPLTEYVHGGTITIDLMTRMASITYRKEWDLRSIPFEAIPDDLLRSWWAKRSVAKREYTIERAPNKQIAEKRHAQREYRRKRRAEGKDK
jgi:hypothetical protein